MRATNFLGHRDKPECESYNISRDIEKNPGPEFDIGPEYESYNISRDIEKNPGPEFDLGPECESYNISWDIKTNLNVRATTFPGT